MNVKARRLAGFSYWQKPDAVAANNVFFRPWMGGERQASWFSWLVFSLPRNRK
jgi:hypothetical protein